MKAPISHSKDPDLRKAPEALLRAAESARLLAEQTGTPFITRSVTPEPFAISENESTLPPTNTTQH
jgi:hypothetical protein